MIRVFAERFKEIRKSSGDTQSEAGEKFGVAQRTIANWENGTREPDIEMITHIAREYDVSVDYLFGLTDIPRSYKVGEAIVLTNVPMNEDQQWNAVRDAETHRAKIGDMSVPELENRIQEIVVETLRSKLGL